MTRKCVKRRSRGMGSVQERAANNEARRVARETPKDQLEAKARELGVDPKRALQRLLRSLCTVKPSKRRR